MLISKTQKNPNRPFNKCSKCNYFQWADKKPIKLLDGSSKSKWQQSAEKSIAADITARPSNEVPLSRLEASDKQTSEGREGISLGGRVVEIVEGDYYTTEMGYDILVLEKNATRVHVMRPNGRYEWLTHQEFWAEVVEHIKDEIQLKHVSQSTWTHGKESEKENEVHPCDNWQAKECMCKGSCRCHWIDVLFGKSPIERAAPALMNLNQVAEFLNTRANKQDLAEITEQFNKGVGLPNELKDNEIAKGKIYKLKNADACFTVIEVLPSSVVIRHDNGVEESMAKRWFYQIADFDTNVVNSETVPLSTDDDVSAPNDGQGVGSNELNGVHQVGTSSSLASGVASFLKVEPITVIKSEFVPSHYQQEIFNFVEGDNGNAVVEAVAGSGKTTTLVKALEYTDPKADVGFIAFNKHIVAELKDRVPSHVHVSTLHSLGLMNAVNYLANGDYKKLAINEYKLWDIWDERIDPLTNYNELKPTVVKLVNLCKSTLRDPKDPTNIDWLIDRYNIDVDGDLPAVYDLTIRLYENSIWDKEQFDFTDMVFLCAIGEIPCHKFDVLFWDEFQDSSDMQLQMGLQSVKSDGRVIAVGDQKQAIYGFSGAGIDSMERGIKILKAKVLPLSISYRCHKGAIRLAQQLVPQIQWRDDAPEGIVSNVEELPNCIPGDMILCRINAPLVAPCFDLIRRGIKATIRGRDIGNGLVQMLKRGEKMEHGSTNASIVLARLSAYVSSEAMKLRRARKEVRAASLVDGLETLIALSDGCHTTGEIRRKIQQVFSDDKASVTFSSTHRAKGLEARRVFILRPDLMPFPKAEQEWELQQEKNVAYVSVSRPKEELYFVGGQSVYFK